VSAKGSVLMTPLEMLQAECEKVLAYVNPFNTPGDDWTEGKHWPYPDYDDQDMPNDIGID